MFRVVGGVPAMWIAFSWMLLILLRVNGAEHISQVKGRWWNVYEASSGESVAMGCPAFDLS